MSNFTRIREIPITGSQGSFTITDLPFLKTTDIKIKFIDTNGDETIVNNPQTLITPNDTFSVITTDYDVDLSSLVNPGTALIIRDTDISTLSSYFYNSSSLDPSDLDRINYQILFRLQEETDKAKDYIYSIGGNNTISQDLDMNFFKIINHADAINDNDAVNLGQLESKINTATTNIQNQINQLETYLTTLINTTEQNVNNSISTTENNLYFYINSEITTLTNTFNQIQTDTLTLIQTEKNFLLNQIASFESSLSTEISTEKQNVIDAINQKENDIQNYLSSEYSTIQTTVNNAKTYIEDLIDNLPSLPDVEGFNIGDFVLTSANKTSSYQGEWASADTTKQYDATIYNYFNVSTNYVYDIGGGFLEVPAISTPDTNQEWFYLLIF